MTGQTQVVYTRDGRVLTLEEVILAQATARMDGVDVTLSEPATKGQIDSARFHSEEHVRSSSSETGGCQGQNGGCQGRGMRGVGGSGLRVQRFLVARGRVLEMGGGDGCPAPWVLDATERCP